MKYFYWSSQLSCTSRILALVSAITHHWRRGGHDRGLTSVVLRHLELSQVLTTLWNLISCFVEKRFPSRIFLDNSFSLVIDASFYLSWIVPGVAWSDHQTHLLHGLAGIIFSSHQKVRNERQKKTTDCILLKFRIQFNTNIHVMWIRSSTVTYVHLIRAQLHNAHV